MSTETVTPEVLWAQRCSATDEAKNCVYLTIAVPDVKPESLKLELKPLSINFTGHSDTLKKTYHVEMDLFAEIDPDASKVNHTAKNIEMKLQKKETKDEYWPRLLKDSKKVHYLKTDFDKWVDEDEQNVAADDDYNFGNMGGMGGMGGDLGGLDFSSLGGGGRDAPMDVDEDDDEMPDLEGDDDADDEGATAKDKSKEGDDDTPDVEEGSKEPEADAAE